MPIWVTLLDTVRFTCRRTVSWVKAGVCTTISMVLGFVRPPNGTVWKISGCRLVIDSCPRVVRWTG